MSKTERRVIFCAVEVPGPISTWEIDFALKYADDQYAEELNVDLLRLTFNTVQALREPGTKLELLVDMVIRENVLESRHKRAAMKGAIMKVYNHRNQVKQAADEAKETQGLPVRPAVKQTQHPFDLIEDDQRVLL